MLWREQSPSLPPSLPPTLGFPVSPLEPMTRQPFLLKMMKVCAICSLKAIMILNHDMLVYSVLESGLCWALSSPIAVTYNGQNSVGCMNNYKDSHLCCTV